MAGRIFRYPGVGAAAYAPAMIDHVGIPVADLAAARELYTALLAPLGVDVQMDVGPALGLGPAGGVPSFWLSASRVPISGEVHLALTAADRATVDAVHQVAVDRGIEVLHAPRLFTEYHPNYYGVFVRDLDGNNFEVVCHQPQ